ncbi:MAG: 3'-5' exonuclease, partial [Halanaerobiales bacterium]
KEVRVDLGRNFRSRGEILEGINFLFSNLMSRKLGEIEYSKKAELVPGLSFDRTPAVNPLELNLLENNSGEIEDENIEDLGRMEMEARFAAGRIKKLLGKTIQDPRNDEIRPLDYRDIVILLRSPTGRIETYQEVFLEENIPLYADSDFGFLETVEIKVFVNLLQILDNQKQDLPFLSVMRSTIGGFSIPELARIRTAFKEGDFQEALHSYAEEKDDVLAAKIKKFQQQLRQWRGEARYMQMDEFIWKLLMDTGYYHFAGSLPGGEKRQANLRVLVERAREFEKTSGAGIFNYLRFIDRVAKSSGDMGTARVIGENENVVRLMSVHKSKGLEFPVVLLGDLGKRFNFNDLKKPILLHRELGIGPRYVDVERRVYSHSLPRLAIKERKKREDLSEELRILYVAMTRAINKMILYGSANNFSTKSKRWLRGLKPYHLLKGKSYLDWIGSVLIHHAQGSRLRELAGVKDEEIEIQPDNSCWEINYYDLRDLGQAVEEEVVEWDLLKEKLLSPPQLLETSAGEEINRRLNWQYPHQKAVELPSKMSVTDIQQVEAGSIENTVYNIPPLAAEPKFAKEESGFTAAEIGSIMHFIMQHLDLTATGREDIARQLKTMKEQKLLDPEEIEVIDITKIVNFFTCKVGRKMLAAEEVYREIPFVLKKRADGIFAEAETKEEILVQGIIDCYFRTGDELILLDYKTDRRRSKQKEFIRRKYNKQLSIYRQALERITEQQVTESYIYLFSQDETIKMD